MKRKGKRLIWVEAEALKQYRFRFQARIRSKLLAQQQSLPGKERCWNFKDNINKILPVTNK